MAYVYRRPEGRIELREAYSTPRGPRSRTLASFRGALTVEHLDRAEAAARRPFDRTAVENRARELNIPVAGTRADSSVRTLLHQLRRGATLDPRLTTLLQAALSALPAQPTRDTPGDVSDVSDVSEWLGASELERGRALRDVLRLYDAIARSREPVRRASEPAFPRFESRRNRAAS